MVCHARPPRPPRQGTSISSSDPGDLSPQQITKLITSAETSAEVLELACKLHAGFDRINSIAALHRTAKHLKQADRSAVLEHPGYALLLQMAAAHAPTLDAREAANGLWALARLPEAPPRQLLDAMTASVQRTLPSMNEQGLANSAWAFARLKHTPGSQLLSALASRAADMFADGHIQVSAAKCLATLMTMYSWTVV